MDEVGDWYFLDKTLLPGEGHGWSAHDHAVITLVLCGRLDECLGREVQSCGPFELHYKPAGLQHVTATGSNGVRMFLLGCNDVALEGLELRAADRPRVVQGGGRAARALSDLLAIARSDPRCTAPPRRALGQLWACVMSSPEAAAAERPTWITEVREWIQAEGAERQSLARVASEFGVHPVYLARAFRTHYGFTMRSLRRRLRIDRAIARLRAERASLAELALDLGYSDQSHFTREFKRETGWTPGRFRAAVATLGRLGRSGAGVQSVQDGTAAAP